MHICICIYSKVQSYRHKGRVPKKYCLPSFSSPFCGVFGLKTGSKGKHCLSGRIFPWKKVTGSSLYRNQFLCAVGIWPVVGTFQNTQCLSGSHACHLFSRDPWTWIVFGHSCKLRWNSWSDRKPMWGRIPGLYSATEMRELQREHRTNKKPSSWIARAHRVGRPAEKACLQQGEERNLLPNWKWRTKECFRIKLDPQQWRWKQRKGERGTRPGAKTNQDWKAYDPILI